MKRQSLDWVSVRIAMMLVAALGLAQLGWAAEETGPALGVARISLTNGEISIQRGDSGDWIEGVVNMPVVEGDTVRTGRASRVELQLDYSNLVRLSESAEVHLSNMGERQFRIQVERGVVNYSELRGGEADIDIETSLVVVRPEKNGRYRIDVLDQDQVSITVRKGSAEVASADGVEKLKKGMRMIVRRDENGRVHYRVMSAPDKDAWDEWNQRRDKVLNNSDSYRRLSRRITGGEDLDDYGRWQNVTGYGDVWFPSVSGGWAPYRHGRWSWLDYYGWTWVGYEPWGWAPYHYGSWFRHTHYGWGWYPGPRRYHHTWRPALVAFFGFGHHSGFSFGVGFGGYGGYGGYGWVPLAPGERYHPWYGHGGGYGGRHGGGNTTIIVDNSINIRNNYRNARFANGVSVQAADRFGRGLGHRPSALRGNELDRATLMRGRLPVVPDARSQGRIVRASNQGAVSGRSRQTRFFNTRSVRNTPARTPFNQQRERISQSVRSFSEANGRRRAASGPAAGSSSGIGRTSPRARAGARAGGGAVPTLNSGTTSGGVRSGTRRSATTAAVPRSGPARTRRSVVATSTSGGSTVVRSPSARGSRSRQATVPRSRGFSPATTSTLGGWSRFGSGRSRGSTPRASTPSTAATPSVSSAPRTGRSRTFDLANPITREGTSSGWRSRSSATSSSRERSPSRSRTFTPRTSSRVPSARAPRSSGSSTRTGTARPAGNVPRSRSRVPSASPGSSRGRRGGGAAVSSGSRRSAPPAQRSSPRVSRSRNSGPSQNRSVRRQSAPSRSRSSAGSSRRSGGGGFRSAGRSSGGRSGGSVSRGGGSSRGGSVSRSSSGGGRSRAGGRSRGGSRR